MKVALVHDDLVQWGGAERVLLAISELFPDAAIFTSVVDYSNSLISQNFKDKKIVTSFIQKIPGWKGLYRPLLPLYPIAFEQFDFSKYDLVISQTTKFAKSVITKPQTKHICYMHTPPRFLWHFSGEEVSSLVSPYLSKLRIYDQISAERVDTFIAGSFNARRRIKKIYKKDSLVLQPFVDLEKYKDLETFEGDYYLIIARLNRYKKVDLAVEGLVKLGKKLIVVGDGPELGELMKIGGGGVEFVGKVSEKVLMQLIAGAKGLIVTAEEDFGLTPLEAQALGKGVIAFGAGGALETVINKETGVFFYQQTVESLMDAVIQFEQLKINPGKCRENSVVFSKKKFQNKLLKIVGGLV